MAVPILDKSQRKYPLAQPEGWQPKMAHYTLRLPSELNSLTIADAGVQAQGDRSPPQSAISAIESWLTNSTSSPAIVDRFNVLFGRDEPKTLIWACYWPSTSSDPNLSSLDLKRIFHNSLSADERTYTGLWIEWFTPDLTRFETNYSGDDYQPGLAGYPGTKQEAHDLTGYWGAARDRIHASAYDRLDISEDGHMNGTTTNGMTASSRPDFTKTTLQKYIQGSNRATIAHIRSGQYWETCPPEESIAYEEKLEPYLIKGLEDVLANPAEKGDYGLRFVRNVPPPPDGETQHQGQERKETCALGYFRSLKDLENWAKDCPSHHKIFGGALSHRNRFGDSYKMRTWHEICVLKPGEARWEYINCAPGTGVLPFVESQTIQDV